MQKVFTGFLFCFLREGNEPGGQYLITRGYPLVVPVTQAQQFPLSALLYKASGEAAQKSGTIAPGSLSIPCEAAGARTVCIRATAARSYAATKKGDLKEDK